jgi:hypothetical protein
MREHTGTRWVKLTPHELGMLHCASRNYRRVYVGRAGCELVGYASGRWWTAISLWLRGHLKRDGRWIRSGYGSPGVHLVITDAGRQALRDHAGITLSGEIAG